MVTHTSRLEHDRTFLFHFGFCSIVVHRGKIIIVVDRVQRRKEKREREKVSSKQPHLHMYIRDLEYFSTRKIVVQFSGFFNV